MVPGKRYSIDDYLRIAWRRKWLLLAPFVLIGAGTFAVAQYLPNRYRSETTILVIPQRVPEDYVPSAITTRSEDRLLAINDQILSRTRLEQVMAEFDLYREERRTKIMQDVIDQMRLDIGIHIPPLKKDTIRVSYTGSDARTVMQVTERLASLFINENLRDREALAESTSQFIQAQLDDARTRLLEHEKKLEQYRRAHAGEMPAQMQTNLQVIQNAQMQLQSLLQSLSQDRDRRMLLERLLADAAAAEPVAPVAVPVPREEGAAQPSGPMTAAQQLEAARLTLQATLLRLKPEHPDVVRLKRTISELEKKADAEALKQPVSTDSAVPSSALSPAESARRTRTQEMRAQIESLDRQIAAKQEDEKRIRATMDEHQRRVGAVPTREAELVELTRDYETLRQIYTGLLQKREQSKMAVNLERRQIGEQFRVIDPARMPERPVSPDRPQIFAAGAFGGLALGVLLVVLLEYRDTSLHSEQDVLAALAMPVLISVPRVITAAEPRHAQRRRRIRWAVGAATAVVAAIGGAMLAWKLRLFANWLP